MAKNSITQYDITAANNTDVGGIDIQGSANVANFDDGLATLMKHIADLNTGASFIHDTYKIADSHDETKLAKFDAGSITAGQTRSFTFPDKDGTFAMSADVLALTGGTLTGFMTLHAAPTSDLHAASKKYVDDNAATTAGPVFTGDAEFENITDGAKVLDASLMINGSAIVLANLNGTGTVSLRKSQGISSASDAGTGIYVFNFSTDMDNADDQIEIACTSGTSGSTGDHSFVPFTESGTTVSKSKQLRCSTHSGTRNDCNHVMYALYGTLAV